MKPKDLSLFGTVADFPVKLLVDTGGSITVLNGSLFRKIASSKSLTTAPSQVPAINTVSGERLPILGQVTLPLEVNSQRYQCQMYVIDDLGYEAVLGIDFLEEKGAVIDFRDRTVQLTDNTSLECLPTTQVVRVVATYIIPPQVETILPAKIEQGTATEGTGMIEPSPQLIQKYCIQGDAILTNPTDDGDVRFRVINPTAKPVVINEGTILGVFTFIDDISHIEEHDSSPPTADLPDLGDVAPHVDLSNSKVTADQQKSIKELLAKYRDVFALTPDELGRTGIIKYTTDTGDSAPIRSRPYRIPEAKKATVDQHIDDMLARGIICESISPWAAPIVLVSKKDGGDRFCVDYRRLNAVTKKDSFPLPRIDSTLEALSGMRLLSTLDLAGGYWQCELDEASKEKTAFISHRGLFEFQVLPSGVVNGPNYFQRLMECILRGLTYETCLIYLDDVIIFSRNFEEHP